MSYSMTATDRYPTMHQPWRNNNWPPLHMQGPYMQQHWSDSAMRESMYRATAMQYPDYGRCSKPPLTQLQELTSVFPPAGSPRQNPPCCYPSEYPTKDTYPDYPAKDKSCYSAFATKEKESYGGGQFPPKENYPSEQYKEPDYQYSKERECYPEVPYTKDTTEYLQPKDCDFADPLRGEKLSEHDAGYSSDRHSLDEGPYSVEAVAPRECDSGFGTTFPRDEVEMCGDCDSGCADVSHPADSDSGCADLTKWPENLASSALPGFQQAFGSTEIGRFSRNDFFTNPSRPQAVEEPTPRKPVRKTRTPRVKQMKKEQPDSPKLKPECYGQNCGQAPYDNCAGRYCPPVAYPRVPPQFEQYPSYPQCDPPYFRPFPQLPTPWPERRWSPYQQEYSQPWASANVYPFMRLDY